MVNSKILAVVIVAIVIVAAVGAYVVLQSDDERQLIDAELKVYGNADKNDKIDNSDIRVIEDIISGDKSFGDHPLADANHDGKVDASDIEQVRKIINVKPGEQIVIWHINVFDGKENAVSTKYPIASAVATGAANSLLVFKYLGINDEIKGLSYAGAPDSTLFPEFQKHVGADKRLGSSATAMSTDLVSNLASGPEKVTAVITADNRSYLATEEPILEEMGIDVVRLQAAAVDEKEYLSSILLIAFLFEDGKKGFVNKCHELIGWYSDFLDDLNGKLEKVDKRASAVTSSSTRAISSARSDYTDVLRAAGALFPEGIPDTSSATLSYTGGVDTWLNAIDIDYVILLRTSVDTAQDSFSWYKGEAEKEREGSSIVGGAKVLREYINNFKTLECFEKGNVYVVCGDMPVMLRIAYCAQILYPDIFGEDYGDKYNLDFVKKFFGWNEDMVKGKPFFVSQDSLKMDY